MSIDFRLINGLFDCELCLNKASCESTGRRACDTGRNGDDCIGYKRDPAYKRKEKPDQRSDASH